MSELLKAKQKLAKGRYIISKALMSGDDGASYLATDTQLDNSACVVREFYPKNKLSEEEQAKYDERFQSSMLILTQFDHPNLTKIYDSFTEKDRYYVVMEHVDGITLQTLLSMSVKPLPAKQVLGWMLQVCQAMQYMHNRPKPFIFDALDANNIMIDQDENIRLINYGLSRFFSDADSISFSSSPDLISKEIKLMGRTMAFLLTRHEVSDLGFDPGDVEVSDDLVRLINRLLADGNGGIRDFDKLQQELNKILNPPKVKERKTDEDGKTFKSFDIGRRLEDLLEKFLGQPVWLIGCEVLAVIGICITVYFTMNPTITERAQSAVYVACGNELHLYSAATKDPLGRIHMKY
ncbi:protein kinase, partial [bacterium]|nr:protein kinase [bacterium]